MHVLQPRLEPSTLSYQEKRDFDNADCIPILEYVKIFNMVDIYSEDENYLSFTSLHYLIQQFCIILLCSSTLIYSGVEKYLILWLNTLFTSTTLSYFTVEHFSNSGTIYIGSQCHFLTLYFLIDYCIAKQISIKKMLVARKMIRYPPKNMINNPSSTI